MTGKSSVSDAIKMEENGTSEDDFDTHAAGEDLPVIPSVEPTLAQPITSYEPYPVTTADQSPRASRSTRRIARRSKHSSRGGVVVNLPSWDRPRIVYFESKLEQRVLFLLLARGDVKDLWEQPPSILYRDQAGLRRTHFPDFLIELRNGRRIAIAVKPAKVAHRSKFDGTLRCVRQAMTKDYADDLVLITDHDFTKAEALNAERYHSFAKTKDPNVQDRLIGLIKKSVFPTSVGQLAEQLDPLHAGFRSVFIGIYEGLLAADRTNLIDMDTEISAGDAQ